MVTQRPKRRAKGGAEDPARTRIRKILLRRGLRPREITEQLIDYWIVQHANDQEEGRRQGDGPPSRWGIGSGG